MSGRRKLRSPSVGVMLQGRAIGLHYWDDEVSADGGKKKLHRIVRAREKAAIQKALRNGSDPC